MRRRRTVWAARPGTSARQLDHAVVGTGTPEWVHAQAHAMRRQETMREDLERREQLRRRQQRIQDIASRMGQKAVASAKRKVGIPLAQHPSPSSEPAQEPGAHAHLSPSAGINAP
jgi:hypothetical protein